MMMKTKSAAIIRGVLLALLLIIGSNGGSATAAEMKNILIIVAQTPDYPVYDWFIRGIKAGIGKELGSYGFRYHYEYLGLINHANEAGYLADTAAYLQVKYARHQPDLIIAGEEMGDFLQRYGQRIFPNAKVVMIWNKEFERMDQLPRQFILLPGTQAVDYGKILTGILQTRPQTRRIYAVLGASDEESELAVNLIQAAKTHEQQQVELILLNQMPYAQMLETVRRAEEDSVILFMRWNADVTGQRFIPAEVQQRISKEARVPLYGHSRHLLGNGVVGGYMMNYESVGKTLGKIGLQVLRGEQSAGVVAWDETPKEYAFDWRELKRWNIPEQSLPPDSKVLFRSQSLWETYRIYLISGGAILLLETVLVVTLLTNRARRRKAEQALLELNLSLERRITQRTEELEQAYNELMVSQQQLEELNRQLDLNSRTDVLTGLYNRRHMEEQLQLLQERKKPFALMLGDIDFFKRVNDVQGHDAGDRLLRSIAETLEDIVQDGGIVARWGGEEFLIMMPTDERETVLNLAEAVCRGIAESAYLYHGERLSATMTLGIAIAKADETIGSLLKRVDASLYKGKQAGRNRVVFENAAGD